jgi:outer membrane protein insertion porin family
MLQSGRLPLWLTAACASALAAGPVHGQDAAALGERPLVERIVFDGAAALRPAELRERIVNEETRCRGLLLRPLCRLTRWRALEDRNRLERQEVQPDALRLRIHYFNRGYRDAAVSSEVRPYRRGVEIVFRIDEGPPTLVESLRIEQTEEVLSRRRIRLADLPGAGDPLDLLRLGDGLSELAGRLGELGWLDAEIRDTIAIEGRLARVEVHIDPQRRATLDTIDIRGNEVVTDKVIADALRLRLGRVLRTTDLVASQRSLYESNLFHEARVVVPEQGDSAKRVEVSVREAPPQLARVGGGFSTLEFGQAEARYTHYNWLGGSRRFDVRGAVGNLLAGALNGRTPFRDVLPAGALLVDDEEFLRPTWQVSADFRQPAFLTAADAVGVSTFAHRRIIAAIAVDEGYGGELSLTRRFDYPTPATLSYRYEMTAVRAGDLYFCVNYGICEPTTVEALRGRQRLSPLSFGLIDDRANRPLAPSAGHRIRVDAEHASDITLSDFGYHRLSGEYARYLGLDLRATRVLAGRVRAGWVQPLEGTAAAVGVPDAEDRILHPRKRFYSGGARSVRGFRENQLGPRVLTINPQVLMDEVGCTTADIASGDCDPNLAPVDAFLARPVGGTSVLEASVEYRFPLRENFQGAVFVDGAIVGAAARGALRGGVSAVTPGAGIRFHSPVGPIRVDLALHPRRVDELAVYTEYMDDDGLRRLVLLDTPRLYDPFEGGGFLRSVLDRLTIHFSIGEAF